LHRADRGRERCDRTEECEAECELFCGEGNCGTPELRECAPGETFVRCEVGFNCNPVCQTATSTPTSTATATVTSTATATATDTATPTNTPRPARWRLHHSGSMRHRLLRRWRVLQHRL